MHPKRDDGMHSAGQIEAGWESTRRRQLTLGLGVSPAERLRWLEQMLLIAYHSGALERRRRQKLSITLRKLQR